MTAGDAFNPFREACGFYPQDIVCRQSANLVSQGQKLLYVRMVRYAGRNGRCFPGQDQLGEDLGVSGRQIRKDLQRLEAVGLIRRLWRQGRRSNSYEFLWHSMFDVDRNQSSCQADDESEPALDLTGTTVPVSDSADQRLTGTTVPVKDSLRAEPESGLSGTTVPSERNQSSGETIINHQLNPPYPLGANAPGETDQKTSTRNTYHDTLVVVARSIHERHPAPRRDCSARMVEKKLEAILKFKRTPASERERYLQRIDQVHAARCSTPDWRKDGGQYAKGLENYLAPTKERYDVAPEDPAEKKPVRLMA